MANQEHLAKLKEGVGAWNAWRAKDSGAGPDLRAANLRGEDLSLVNLSKSNLSRAGLLSVDLSGADLSGANLRGANLREARLLGANLSKADLIATDLRGAQLKGVELRQAVMGQTLVARVSLKAAGGLEEVRHRSPSTLGIETLRRSKGQIPDSFLRGCGLHDWEIEFARIYREDLTQGEATEIAYRMVLAKYENPIEFYSCFISYSHQDKTFAHRLHDQLQGRGIRCWLDEKQMLPGDDLYEQVDQGIRLWDKVLVCCSKASLSSWWVDNEIGTAFEKERGLMKERGEKVLVLIPLDLDGYLLNGWNSGLAQPVKRRLAADFKGWDPAAKKLPEEALEAVIKALRADEGGRARPPELKL